VTRTIEHVAQGLEYDGHSGDAEKVRALDTVRKALHDALSDILEDTECYVSDFRRKQALGAIKESLRLE